MREMTHAEAHTTHNEGAGVPWHQSGLAVLLGIVLLPPVGFVLLWLRRGTSVWRKLLGSFAAIVLGIIYLFVFFGMRLVSDGTGFPTIVTFEKPEDHYAELERNRAAQRAAAPAAAQSETPAAQPTTPASTPATDAASARDAKPAPAASASEPVRAGTYWREYRGPGRDGVYDEMPILTAWPSAGLRELWRQPVGGGYASFSIAEGRAFTIEQRRDREVVAAYDVETGRELWTHSWAAFFQESMGGDGPRATPTWDDGRVYALGATGELHALDAATGERIWSRNILEDAGARNITWGMAASPLIVDGKVIVLPGGSGGKSVVAYNKLTGERVWSAQSDRQAYVSPVVVTLAGKRQLLVVSANRAMGLTVEAGELLWEFPWTTMYDVNSAQPVVIDANRFVISSGYDHGAALIEVTAADGGFRARAVWESRNLKSRFNSSVLHEGYIYGFDESIFACIDARTGERKWKGGRYGYGQVLLAGGHLIILSESGDVALVRATPERHEELARFSAIEGKTWNVPAISGGKLFVRNSREMAAFDLSSR
jgi:outer membrane protein assembly factor BamB